MIINELSLIEVFKKVLRESLEHSEVANIISVKNRRIRRMIRLYKNGGATGLISRKRGAPSNHCLQTGLKKLDIKLIYANTPQAKGRIAKSFSKRA